MGKTPTLEKFYGLTLGLICLGILFYIWNYISSTVTILIFSFLLTTILLPFVDGLERKIHSRILSTLLVTLSVLVLLIGFFTGFAAGMIQQSSEFYVRLTEENYTNELYNMYRNVLSNIPGLSTFDGLDHSRLVEKIQLISAGLIQNFLTLATSGMRFVFLTVMVFVFTFILLIEYHHFRRTLVAIIPNKYFEVGLRIIHNTEVQMSRYLSGQLLAASSIATLSFIGLFILYLSGANLTLIVFISIIAGLSNLIPLVGPFVGMVPALMVAVMNNLGNDAAMSHMLFNVIPSPFYLIDIILIFLIVQQIDNNFITPTLVGDSVGLHPMLVMIVLFIGGSVLGPLGMLFAVPAAGFIKVIAQEVVFLVRYAHLL